VTQNRAALWAVHYSRTVDQFPFGNSVSLPTPAPPSRFAKSLDLSRSAQHALPLELWHARCPSV